jgi:hypothetical protein
MQKVAWIIQSVRSQGGCSWTVEFLALDLTCALSTPKVAHELWLAVPPMIMSVDRSTLARPVQESSSINGGGCWPRPVRRRSNGQLFKGFCLDAWLPDWSCTRVSIVNGIDMRHATARLLRLELEACCLYCSCIAAATRSSSKLHFTGEVFFSSAPQAVLSVELKLFWWIVR